MSTPSCLARRPACRKRRNSRGFASDPSLKGPVSIGIFEANKPMLTHPDRIYPGQVLRIPALDA